MSGHAFAWQWYPRKRGKDFRGWRGGRPGKTLEQDLAFIAQYRDRVAAGWTASELGAPAGMNADQFRMRWRRARARVLAKLPNADIPTLTKGRPRLTTEPITIGRGDESRTIVRSRVKGEHLPLKGERGGIPVRVVQVVQDGRIVAVADLSYFPESTWKPSVS